MVAGRGEMTRGSAAVAVVAVVAVTEGVDVVVARHRRHYYR